MVSHRDKERLRSAQTPGLSAADRESLLKPYLPDPSELRRRTSQSQAQAHSQSQTQSRRPKKSRRTPIRSFLKSQLHHLAYTLIHIIFGIAVRLIQTYHAVIDRVFAVVYHHHRTPELIRKDMRGLKRVPEHLSVILGLRKGDDDAVGVLMDEVAELAAWSACSGIGMLSVYERSGRSTCP